MSLLLPNDPGRGAAGQGAAVRWRSSRHARRLLTLGLFGVFIATIRRRRESAGLAAPALRLLAAARIQRRPPRSTVRGRPSTRRAFEGELVALDMATEDPGDCTIRWLLHPGQEIEPAGAVTADGPAARFLVSPHRGGRRELGTVDVELRDRWRLAEGHLTVTLPRIDCYPAPAHQRTQVVLNRLPNRLGGHPARGARAGVEVRG